MIQASFAPILLTFKEAAITSRQTMHTKESYLLRLTDTQSGRSGIGECALFRGLSAEDTPEYSSHLMDLCSGINRLAANSVDDLQNHLLDIMPQASSIRFGLEGAILSLSRKDGYSLYDTPYTRQESPLTINGLVWMGDKVTMARRIRQKLEQGFRCIKLKIGGIRFDDEVDLLRTIRRVFSADDIQLRLDANGSFSADNALQRLQRLSEFEIHSIEQPIRAGQWEQMRKIADASPIPIALDEELIGTRPDPLKRKMLETIGPQYIILKPSLCGGLTEADRWIQIAKGLGIGWWATSALESNIGLSAIAQWVSRYEPNMPQGLGTGMLYLKNFPAPLRLEGEQLWFDKQAISSNADADTVYNQDTLTWK